MFTRTHTVSGGYAYTEALEAYRDPVTRRPRHRCIARWPAEWSLAEAITEAEKGVTWHRRRTEFKKHGHRFTMGETERKRRVRAADRAAARLEALRLVRDALTAPAPPP